MSEQELIKRERAFLAACGMNLDNGYFSDDVTFWKLKEPELYREHLKMVVWP